MAGHIDWDNAVVVVRVHVHHTASASVQEVSLTFRQLAALLWKHIPELVDEDNTRRVFESHVGATAGCAGGRR